MNQQRAASGFAQRQLGLRRKAVSRSSGQVLMTSPGVSQPRCAVPIGVLLEQRGDLVVGPHDGSFSYDTNAVQLTDPMTLFAG